MYEQDEEDYNRALDVWDALADFAEKQYDRGINPFTGEKFEE